MKRFLFTLAAAMLSLGVLDAQVSLRNLPRMTFDRPSVASTNAPRMAPSKIKLDDNQLIMGGYSTDELAASGQGLGVGSYTTGRIGAFILLPIAAVEGFDGGKVVKMRVGLAQSASISHLYIYPVIDGKIQNAIVSENVSASQVGWNEFTLQSPVDLDFTGYDAILMGYEYNQRSNAYPISAVYAGSEYYDLFIYGNLGGGLGYYAMGNSYGNLSVQAVVEGDFAQNAARLNSHSPFIVPLNGSESVDFGIRNTGKSSISSVDYKLSIDGVETAEEHVDLGNVAFGDVANLSVTFNSADTVKTQTYQLTITKVNDQENEDEKNSISGLFATYSRVIEHRVAVEEYTGVGCQWCPRGYIGMEKLRATYGDKFVGIAIHQYNQGDAMFVNPSAYADLGFTGAPSCAVDRLGIVDPYYGASDGTNFAIRQIFDQLSSQPALVDVGVSGEWNADSTKVTATAVVDGLIDGVEYNVEFILVGDSLKGPSNTAWNQMNAYAQYTVSQVGSQDMAPFCKGGIYGKSSVSGLYYNDVALASSYVGGINQAESVTIRSSESNIVTYTLSLPAATALRNAIDTHNLYVVALVTDPTDGSIVNSVKAQLPFFVPSKPLIADGTYYLQNVATGKYLAAGHDMGTRAIVNEDGLDFILTGVEGKYTIDSQVGGSDDSHYLNAGLYVDGTSFKWVAEEVADGIFTLSDGSNFLAVADNDEAALVATPSEAAQWKTVSYEERISALGAASQEHPANATFAIRDANFGRNDTRSLAWTVVAGSPSLSGGNGENNNAESMAAFEIVQTLTGMPVGVYQLTAQAAVTFHDDKVAKEYDGNGYPVVYANTESSNFNLMDADDQLTSVSQMSEHFTAGKYTVEPVTVVVVDGIIRLGVKSSRDDIWAVWDNLQLVYLGNQVDVIDFTVNHCREAEQGYETSTVDVDLLTAKTFLGVDRLTTDMLYIENPDGTLIHFNPDTDAADGYDGWFSGEGVAEKQGDNSKICVKFFQSLSDGTFEVCDMNGADEVGKTYSVTWRLVNGQKSVRYHINVTFVVSSGIETVDIGQPDTAMPYNLNGQRVSRSARGFLIIGGRKIFNR